MDQRNALTGPDGEPAGVRRLLCDLIGEYGRHTGHADLLRESVDGLVGEEPPPGWRPRPGRCDNAAAGRAEWAAAVDRR